MPMPNLPVPQFPNVPNVPGVPALVRTVGAPVLASVNSALISVGLGQFALGLSQPVWGIFDANNDPIAVSDSVGALEFGSDSHISNAPMEQGAFQSYNKVQLPFEARVRLHCGGAIEKRQAFLQAIELASKSTDLYSIVTPEASYFQANVAGYRYRRETRNGATLLTVEVALSQIREATAAQFSNTGESATTGSGAPVAFGSSSSLPASQVQNPASADPISLGQVQGTTLTPAQNFALLQSGTTIR
ncbi:hypothetical protein AX768_09220 [Burkholderia sp. PAMC 28687]|nr:hypothetical protein AX768_09220 [Burkholderia sp. PAMC 28687]